MCSSARRGCEWRWIACWRMVVALVVNSLKHIIGRPRPRLTHSGGWHWWPSLSRGSFPSAIPQPRSPWRRYYAGAASLALGTVCLGRVGRGQPDLRGSHFPGDVVGMALGFVVGSVCNGQLRWWKQSFAQAVVRIAPIVLLLTGFCWCSRTALSIHGGQGAHGGGAAADGGGWFAANGVGPERRIRQPRCVGPCRLHPVRGAGSGHWCASRDRLDDRARLGAMDHCH